MKYRNDLSYEFVSSILDYDPETGILIWKKDQSIADRKSTDPKNKYMRICINKKEYMSHRIAWLIYNGSWPFGDLDHINMIKTDNRIINLREADQPDNQANVGIRVDNKTGYKGVGFHKASKKYRARIVRNGKRTEIGYFLTPEEAHEAYKQAAIQLHGDYARY